MTVRLAKARLRGAQAPSLPCSDLRARARALRVEAMRLLAEAEGLDLAADAAEPRHATEGGPLVGPSSVGVTSTEWRAAIRRGELRGLLVGRRLLARRSDVEAWLSARTVTASRVEAEHVEEAPAPFKAAVAAPPSSAPSLSSAAPSSGPRTCDPDNLARRLAASRESA